MNLAIGLRNLRRVREILSVLVLDYGFGYVFDQFDLARFFPLGRRRGIAREYAHLSGPQRLRLALGELGPTFIKLGQVLSARADLLPPPVVRELRHLQDNAPAIPFEELRSVIETELGRPLEQCFEHIDPIPISAASLGQVHAATLRDGRQVTVKVLRPGVNRIVEGDLQILFDVAHLLHRQVPSLQRYQLPTFGRRFATQIEDELVYTLEAHNAERLARNLESAQMKVRLPAVIWSLTTRRVLTTERVEGRRVDRLSGPFAELDRPAVAAELARCLLHQMFVDGFFHGDPHPGNLLVNDEGQIVFLDFGMVGILRPERRMAYSRIFFAIISNDIDMLIDTLDELGIRIDPDDVENFKDEMYVIYKETENYELDQFSFGDTMNTLTSILHRYKIVMPGSFMLMIKVITMIGDVGSHLDPEFDIIGKTTPYLNKLIFSSMFSAESLDDAKQTVTREVLGFPKALRRFLENFSSGRSRMEVTVPEL
ncbi:AarF/ABC1/UbiB kinase family protein, partial [bacterium]|nr:AarF/ABC1/UbiB kinase family protein [bacterium]